MELTILMPCLNEAETIVACVKKAHDFLERENISGEILIADNGSTDGSQNLAMEQGARVIQVPQRGYGAALMSGIKQAQGKYIIMGDADDSYDFSNLSLFVEKLRQGNDLVMGNRFKGGIKPGAMPFLNKYLGNPVLSFLGRLFFKCPIRDFHCGLRGMKRDVILQLDLQTTGMEFASEMVVKAALKNIKIAEVPTILSPDGRSRPPHLRKWRDGWRHLRFLLLLSPRWMFFYPGALLGLVGLAVMITLSATHLKMGHHSLGVHTLLFGSAFFVVGLQSMFFALCSSVIASIELKCSLDKKSAWLVQQFTLERGIVVGLVFILLGLMGSIASLLIWMNTQFGELVPAEMMRLTIPAVTCLITGTGIIFSSFFMKLLLMSYQNEK